MDVIESTVRDLKAEASKLLKVVSILTKLPARNHQPKRRVISAAGRARIAAAQRKRWAKLRREAA